MASYNQNTITLTLILLSLISILSRTYAGDNDTLVDQMCGATIAPYVCTDCIKSRGRGAQTQGDVIQEMLGCGDTNSLRLEQVVNETLDDDQLDLKTRTILFSMNPLIQEIISSGGTVHVQVAQGRLDDARSTISNVIIQNLGECNYAFNHPGINIPPLVFYKLFDIKVDYQVSDELIALVKAKSANKLV